MINFNAIDLHVGARIKIKRTILGLSQTQLATALGVSFQQVQKYENGKNRISASKLFVAARFLNEPPEYFFGGIMTVAGETDSFAPVKGLGGARPSVPENEALRAMRAYGSIKSEASRLAMRRLMRAVGDAR